MMRKFLLAVGFWLAALPAFATQSGTVTLVPNGYQYLNVTVSSITNGTNSPNFNLRGYPFTSYVASGTQGSGGSVQLQGSNDGGTTWVSIGSAITTLPAGGTLTPSQVPYELYRFNVTAGDSTTSYNFAIVAYGTRG